MVTPTSLASRPETEGVLSARAAEGKRERQEGAQRGGDEDAGGSRDEASAARFPGLGAPAGVETMREFGAPPLPQRRGRAGQLS